MYEITKLMFAAPAIAEGLFELSNCQGNDVDLFNPLDCISFINISYSNSSKGKEHAIYHIGQLLCFLSFQKSKTHVPVHNSVTVVCIMYTSMP